MSSLQDMWQILGRRGSFLPPDPWAAPKMPILNRVKMILVLFHGQVRVERGFNVNKDTLPNLEVNNSENYFWSLSFKRFIPSVNCSNQGVGSSVHKAPSRQRIDLVWRKEKEASDARTRKAEASTKDINKLKSKKAMLEKLQ